MATRDDDEDMMSAIQDLQIVHSFGSLQDLAEGFLLWETTELVYTMTGVDHPELPKGRLMSIVTAIVNSGAKPTANF